MVCNIAAVYGLETEVRVLILILLEYGLQQERKSNSSQSDSNVLILILLEYGLQPTAKFRNSMSFLCLNPYSTGIWSATLRGVCRKS